MQISAKEILNDVQKFYKLYKQNSTHKFIGRKPKPTKINIPEITTILILYQCSGYRYFKYFYFDYLSKYYRRFFPHLPSYSWFLRLQKSALHFMIVYLQNKKGKQTGVYYIDSCPIKVCHNKRIQKHRVYKGLATRGHHSMGWFYGFKLHIIINDEGDLMDIYFTQGNKHDRIGLEKMGKNLEGILCGDKGYLGKDLHEEFAQKKLKVITKVRRNMKQKKLNKQEKYYLRRRGIVETVIGLLKNFYQLENYRLRSVWNLFTTTLSCLLAYILKPFKPLVKPYVGGLIRS